MALHCLSSRSLLFSLSITILRCAHTDTWRFQIIYFHSRLGSRGKGSPHFTYPSPSGGHSVHFQIILFFETMLQFVFFRPFPWCENEPSGQISGCRSAGLWSCKSAASLGVAEQFFQVAVPRWQYMRSHARHPQWQSVVLRFNVFARLMDVRR